ncbi:hypothetical protein HETIRDRAFT_455943 [Heterobasidion irregulare TC 32-1]|uniref:Uncharacterized protein n=1 Tax=Heterobasidion irregulare (strain TC 32-1) TaxID=747525 RepID=W4JQE7_HETIT|nr:uncharacterized protein HETIRDRAFT_455943 [Heterobasidion irregulare TC 32-1]ETW75295.1 hypothetical protein HETIRDRAFT_455943 [Heterobasidion irregulare TC 32-1]
MFSFVKLATVAAIALGAITAVCGAPHPADVAEVKRQTSSLTTILADLAAELAPSAAQLSSLNSKNATMETISPIVSRISTSVQNSMTQIKALPAQGNKVTSDEVASGLNNVMQTVLVPAKNVMAIRGVDSAIIIPAFLPLGVILDGLVGAVLITVGELVFVVKATLATLLGGLTAVIFDLGFTTLISTLGLVLGLL